METHTKLVVARASGTKDQFFLFTKDEKTGYLVEAPVLMTEREVREELSLAYGESQAHIDNMIQSAKNSPSM